MMALSSACTNQLSTSVSRRRWRSGECAFTGPTHRNHGGHGDEQRHVVPLWKVDSDACTDRDDSHAKQNERFKQKPRPGWTCCADSGRWTFWHDGLAWLGGRKGGLRPLRKLRKLQSEAVPLLGRLPVYRSTVEEPRQPGEPDIAVGRRRECRE